MISSKDIKGHLNTDGMRYPFAQLSIFADELRIDAPFLLETIVLKSDKVLGFSEYKSFSSRYIVIWHNDKKSPDLIIFGSDIDSINQAAREVGFVCRGIGEINYTLIKEYNNRTIAFLIFLVALLILVWCFSDYIR